MANKKKITLTVKIIILVVLVILLVALLLFAFLLSKLDLIQFDDEINNAPNYTEDPNASDPDTTEPEEDIFIDNSGLETVVTAPSIPDTEVSDDANVLNILLIGTDERTKNFSTNARSDSMIIVSIDKKNNTVKLVSLERGIAVPVLDGQYKGQYDWLTHIFRYGGADLLMDTVEYCFKVQIDHYVRINFHTFEQIIDSVGGVDIELSAKEAEALNAGIASEADKVHAGVNHMDGEVALSYARLRAIDSDWVRVTRQRMVILAVVDALKDTNLFELNSLADEVLPLIQTNLSKLEIMELILYAPNFLSASFDQMTIPKKGTYGTMSIMGGKSGYALDFEINNDILYRFLYEGATSEELLG